MTATPAETADYLLAQYFPDDDPSTDTPSQHSDRNRSKTALPNSTDDPHFTATELSSVISSFDPKKAPGLDGFNASIIGRVHSVIPSLLLSLFNLCLSMGHFPKEWKAAAVKLLPKPGQPEDSHKANRPISLLPLLGKCLEKLISRRLSWYALTKQWVTENQYAFLPGRGAEDALVALTTTINEAFHQKEYCLAVKIDISGAFDNCWWPATLNYLIDRGCPINLFRVIRSFLSDRSAQLSIANITVSRSPQRGCPQGSVLAPLLWILQLQPLLNMEFTHRVKLQAYADDIMITVRGTCRGDIELPANNALELVLQWCRDRKLAIQPNKTEAVVFTRKTTPLHLRITAADANAQISPSMKYLGVHFDSKLTWHAHLDFITAKLHRLHGHLLQCLRATWGLGPDALRHLYIGAIEPALTYGCSSWGNVVTKQWARTKLLSTQRLFALRIIRGFRTVSTEASLLLAGLIPIDLRIQERMAHYAMRRNAELPERITADPDGRADQHTQPGTQGLIQSTASSIPADHHQLPA